MFRGNGDLLLGIDIGTTGTKCSIYDFEGSIIATAYQEYPMIHKFEGWTEQNPDVWWRCVCENLQHCFSGGRTESSRIAAISVSCTNAVCLVDENGKVLYNAIGLHDQRAGDQVCWLEDKIGLPKIRALTGNRLAKGSCALSSMRWIIDHHPELILPGCKFLSPSGFVIKHLTGEFSINISRMDLACIGNIFTGKLEPAILEQAEIPEVLLPEVFKATDIIGTVSRKAAEQTGLCPGIPVAAGSVDTVAATLGSGAINPGDLAITIGSSGRICYVSESPNFDNKAVNAHTMNGKYLVIQTTDNAGVSLRWFRDLFGRAAYSPDELPDKNIYKRIDETAQAAGAGADGIIYLPYLAGEKSPIWNPDARGVFFNIGLNTSFGSFARAVLEGVAFSIRDCANWVLDTSDNKAAIPIGGGIANSRIWCQIFADILGRPILRLKTNETETLGDIIVAANAVGIEHITPDFGKKLSLKGETLYPRLEYRQMYDENFDRYKKLYEAVKPLF